MLAPQTNSHRACLSLDGLWKFRVQTTGDDATAWPQGFPTDRMVAVPASFNEQFTDYDTFNHMGKVWYARSIQVPAALVGLLIHRHTAHSQCPPVGHRKTARGSSPASASPKPPPTCSANAGWVPKSDTPPGCAASEFML